MNVHRDIVDRLEDPAWIISSDPRIKVLDETKALSDMKEAAGEIRELRDALALERGRVQQLVKESNWTMEHWEPKRPHLGDLIKDAIRSIKCRFARWSAII